MDNISKQALEEQALEECSLAGHGGYSRAGKVALSCSGGQAAIAQDLVHLHARS